MKFRLLAFSLCLACCTISTARADWVQTNGPEAGPVTHLSVNPINGDILAVANDGVYRSQNGGAAWEPLFNGLPADLIAISTAGSGTTAYIGGSLGASAGVYRSNDGGSSWVRATASGLPGIPIIWDLRIEGSTLLAALEGSGVYKSTDGGDTWTSSNTGIPAGVGIARLAASGSDLYAGTTISSSTKAIYRSTDGGANWAATNVTFLTGFNNLFGLTANASGVFAATSISGGYRTTDGGGMWVKINPDVATDFETAIYATSTNLFGRHRQREDLSRRPER